MAGVVQSCVADPCTARLREREQLARLESDAAMAGSAYEPMGERNAPAGFREVTDADELAKLGLTVEDINPSDSDFRAAVFEGDDGEHIVAFKGTTTAEDMMNNLAQGVGAKSEYYSRAMEISTAMKTKNVNVRFTGHSLGGGLASAAARSVGSDASTFNAAGLHEDTVEDPVEGGHIDAVAVKGEVLTSMQQGPLPKAAASQSWSLDPPEGIGSSVIKLAGAAGAFLGGLGIGTAGAIAGSIGMAQLARGVVLHRMPSVEASLRRRSEAIDAAIEENGCIATDDGTPSGLLALRLP